MFWTNQNYPKFKDMFNHLVIYISSYTTSTEILQVFIIYKVSKAWGNPDPELTRGFNQ